MDKDFDAWNSEKKVIHHSDSAPLCHEREIWFCAVGLNVGFEQDGTGTKYDRLILVIKGFNKRTFFGVTLTGHKKEKWPYYSIGQVAGRDASVNLSQVRTIDTKRLIRKITTLDKDIFAAGRRVCRGDCLIERICPRVSGGEAEARCSTSIASVNL